VGPNRVVLRTGHHPLLWLTCLVMRWMEFLSRFHFELEYVRGVDNTAADALSRNPSFTAAFISACFFAVATRSHSRALARSTPAGRDPAQPLMCTREPDCAAPSHRLAEPQKRAVPAASGPVSPSGPVPPRTRLFRQLLRVRLLIKLCQYTKLLCVLIMLMLSLPRHPPHLMRKIHKAFGTGVIAY
jgi:hypothetical protein